MDERANQITAAADSDELRTTSTSADDYDENTEQLRANIEDTRADMSQTLNEIQERLSPENLMDQAKEAVREATIGKVERAMGQVGETLSAVTEPALEVAGRAGNAIKEVGTTVGDQIWKNPIPLALIGLGVGMLVMKNYRGQSSYGNGSTQRKFPEGKRTNYAIGDAGQPQPQSTGSSTLNQVKDTASDLANRSTQTLNELGTKAKNSASRFGEIMRDNPLAAGAVAIAAGTAVGLLIPSTQMESEYIGETGERLVEKVEDVARDALGKVQDAAKQMAPGQQQQQPPA
jgi:ElaB/YqjD/DUF883 family membrane-anchored ribosome-binding protein